MIQTGFLCDMQIINFHMEIPPAPVRSLASAEGIETELDEMVAPYYIVVDFDSLFGLYRSTIMWLCCRSLARTIPAGFGRG